jgi:hypothetical protein
MDDDTPFSSGRNIAQRIIANPGFRCVKIVA